MNPDMSVRKTSTKTWHLLVRDEARLKADRETVEPWIYVTACGRHLMAKKSTISASERPGCNLCAHVFAIRHNEQTSVYDERIAILGAVIGPARRYVDLHDRHRKSKQALDDLRAALEALPF